MKSTKLIRFNRGSIVLMLLFVLLLGGATTPAQAVGTTTTLDGQVSCESFGGIWTPGTPYGECEVYASLAAGDTLIISGANLIAQGFDNAGTIIIEQGFIFNNGTFYNSGTININQDAIFNSGSGTLINNGIINIGKLVDVDQPVGIGNEGIITNNGTITVDCGGDIADLGGSFSGNAVLDVCGGLTDESSCQDLGGTWTLGLDYDVCQVSSLTIAVDDVFMIYGKDKFGVELKITGNLTNNGTIIIQRGLITNEGNFNNSGTIDIFEYAIVNNGTLTNDGTINILDNGNEFSVNGITNEVGGTITNNGNIITDCGRGLADDGGNYSGNPVVDGCDTTPPVITPNVAGTRGNNGWYTSNVAVSWTVVDNESTISNQAGCTAQSVTSDTGGVTFTCTATSVGGTDSKSVTIKRDATAPTISAAATTGPNGTNGWYTGNVTVRFTCDDGIGSGIPASACPADQVLSTDGTAVASTAQTVTDAAGNTSASSNIVTVKIDKTKPTISAAATTTPNGTNGWYTGNVTIHFTCTDTDGSGIPNGACPADQTLSTDGAAVASAAQTVTDAAGNTSAASNVVTVKIDKTKPTFGACPAGGPFLLNSGVQAVGPITVDASVSGLNADASTLNGSVDAGSVGTKNVTFTAVDNAGNSAMKDCAYSVNYNWSGFFQPVDNLPMLNSVKAGSAVPVKFSLAGNQGLNIFAAGYPASQQIACSSTATDAIETTVTAGSSSLSYDATTDQYNYVWKTDKAWAGTCRTLTVKLIDGTIHQANFKFTR